MPYRAEQIKKVLILSPLIDQALAVARYLHRYDHDWVIHGGFMPGETLRVTPPYKEILIVDGVHKLEGYDIVLPTGARSTYWMATQFEEFKVNGLSYSKKNLQCFDKIGLLSLVSRLGIPIPKTYETIDKIDTTYPIFYKQKFEKGKGARGIALSRSDLEKLPGQQNLIFQEYIPGRTTYGMGFIVQKGEILVSFQHEELLSYPFEGGSAVFIRQFNDERLKIYTERILQALGFEGWGLAEYKYCAKRRDFVFMEINAKLWASIEFAFMNNNKFLNHMFGINYPEEKIDSALFVDRLVFLGWKQILRNSPNFLYSKIITYQTPLGILQSLIVNMLPPKYRQLLKKIVSYKSGK